MYLSSIDKPSVQDPDSGAPRRRRLALVGSNVFALGAVSLITDISSEMVTAILPVYLVVGLRLSPLSYGVVDGVYTGATALLRLVGGYVADRVRRPQADRRHRVRAVRGGQARPARRRPVGRRDRGRHRRRPGRQGPAHRAARRADHAVQPAGRAGPGVRRAPGAWTASARSSARSWRWACWPRPAVSELRRVFVTSFCIAAHRRAGAGAVRPRTAEAAPGPGTSAGRRAPRWTCCGAPVRALLLAAALLGLSTIGDGFVYLLLQRREQIAGRLVPAAGGRHQPGLPAAGRPARRARRPDRPAAGGARRLRRADRGLPAAVRATRRLAADLLVARAVRRCSTPLPTAC